MLRAFSLTCLVALTFVPVVGAESKPTDTPVTQPAVGVGTEYKVLATKKTSTMLKEMNEAAEAGYRFAGVMGGETSFGGSEVVVILQRAAGMTKATHEYALLATSKTSTMQKEMQAAGEKGFGFCGQTVFESSFGGQEVVVILERDRNVEVIPYEFKLLATKKTSTMEKELAAVGRDGFEAVGMTVGSTLVGPELVAILRRKANR